MVRRRQRGFTLLEVIISMSIFLAFLIVAFTLTSEMRGWEKRLPVNFMRHPQIISVVARMRRDVLDVQVPPSGDIYVGTFKNGNDEFTNGEKTAHHPDDGRRLAARTIVWDFSEPGVARRIAYNVGNKSSEWTARGLPPEFSSGVGIKAVKFDGRRTCACAAHRKRTAMDRSPSIRILQPRALCPALRGVRAGAGADHRSHHRD